VPHIAPGEAEFLAPFLSLTERLASLLVQWFPGSLSELRVVTQGEVGERSQDPIQVAALCGALRQADGPPVTPVNARAVAAARGVGFQAERTTLKRDFVNLVRVEVVIDGQRHIASGTLIGRRHLRLVELDAFLLDAIPEGTLLVTLHRDRPGVMGRLGTLFGNAQINISRMQIGQHRSDAALAIGIFNLDQRPDDVLLAAIRQTPEVESARRIELPGGTDAQRTGSQGV
jgi:D-3-phosphoglycerate dehydrogenase